MYGVEKPEIKLLNIGIESWKGTSEHKILYHMINESGYNFTGNIEGDKLLLTSADIVISDGFSGNICLKLIESFNDMIKNIYNNNNCKTDHNLLTFLTENFSYENVGAAFLLGVNGRVAVGHGKSSAKAVKSGLELCLKYCKI